jgi:hypothetical protein
MASRLVTIPESNFGGGIDSQSPPNKIPEGYVEELLNADPKPAGAVKKRAGYQGYAGNVPVRVSEIISAGTSLTFNLDTAVDLSTTRSTPIVVQGRSSNSSGGDITTTNSINYYSSFSADLRTNFEAGTGTDTIAATTHDFGHPYIWVGASASDSISNSSNTIFYPDSISVNKSTYAVSVQTTNGTGSDFTGYLYYADREQESTVNYWGNASTQGAVQSILTGTNSYAIPLAVHQISSNLILAKVFQDDGTSYIEITPDSVSIDKSTKEVTISLTNGTGAAFDAIFSLSVAPTANYETGAVATSSSTTVTVDLTAYADRTNFVFLGCFIDNGTTYSQVIPDSIVIDADAETMEVTFTDSGAGGANFALYWQFISLTVSSITVTQGSSATYTDTRPQLTIWGLDHEEIYAADTNEGRGGWVTHLDSYKSTGESRLVAGLGGNLYSARESSEGTYLMPTLYPNIQSTLASDSIIGPAFYATGQTPARTRGYITGTAGGTNLFTLSSVSYDSGTGWVKYIVSVPSLVVSGTLSTIISTTGIRDKLVVAGTSFAVHNGTFEIRQVTQGADLLNIWVNNTSVTSTDWDIAGAGGTAGIFTDQVTLSGSNPFISGDLILCDLFASTLDINCYGTSSLTLGLTDVTSVNSLPTGLKLVGSRSTSVIPLRDLGGTADVTNLVRGDVISYSPVARELRVKHINEMSDISITIAAGDGEEAVVTLGSGNTSSLWEGEKVLIKAGTYYQGVFEINMIDSSTTFTIASAYTSSDSATLVGKTIQVDEVLTVSDSTTSSVVVEVPRRWYPVEAPDDSFDLTPTTYIHHFDTEGYTNQNFLRSTMVKNSLFLTNGDDEVMKFDGTNLYRAGLPRWQPQAFLTVDTGASAEIAVSNPVVTTSAHSNNKVTAAESDAGVLEVGDRVVYSIDGVTYSVVSKQVVTGSAAYFFLNKNVTGASGAGTLTRVSRFKYYFRLNAIDANNAVVASAVAGSDDYVAELGADAAVRLKLIGMPAFDNYDYDRIDVEIYRTKANTAAPFYKIATIPVTFDEDSGSINYVDTDADDDLFDLDSVSTALSGAELGTAWSEPLRAKYVTSAGNRLVLGNLKDYPKLDIQVLRKAKALAAADFADQIWTFRKDNTSTSTTTNMVDVARYQLKATSGAGTVNGVTATTSNFTVTTSAAHGLAIGNWVYLFRSTAIAFDNRWSGWWQVTTVPTTDTFTVLYENEDVEPATTVNRWLVADTKTDIPVPLGTDGNYGMLNGNAFGPEEFRVMRRLGDAINSSMRQTQKSLTGQSTFEPWMYANSGNDFQSGQLIVQSARAYSTTPEVKTPASIDTDMEIYVNSIKRAAATEVSAVTKLFPSRIIASYPNFPEIFDAPTALQDLDSASAIDVNPADGQEITAIIPFFGESAFGSAQKSGVVVVFKTNSIYLVDLAAKDAGIQAVQRLESQGKGCTAPYSVTVTRDGIIFANDTGIYRLNRSLQVDYVGRKYEGIFKDDVEVDYLSLAHGHHDAIDNKYKLGYVLDGATLPSRVAVYNHVREYESQSQKDGSWTTYTNHPVIGWANLDSDAYFAATTGRVFEKRRTGLVQDYRDDSDAVQMTVVTRAVDFGDSGIRKAVRAINTHFIGQDSVGTSLKVALDLVDNFDTTDSFEISDNGANSGLYSSGEFKVNTIQTTIDKAKGTFFQLKYENSTVDEPLEIVGIDFRVTGMSEKGIRQPADT